MSPKIDVDVNLNPGAPTSLQQLKEEDPDLHSFLERFPFPNFSNFIFSDYILNVFVVSSEQGSLRFLFSPSHYDFHTGFLEVTHGAEPALKLRDS